MRADKDNCSRYSDDDLELYVLGRLPQAVEAPMEEHLLVCDQCADRVAAFDLDTAAMKIALRRLDLRESLWSRFTRWLSTVAFTRRVWLAAPVAALLLVTVLPLLQRNSSPPVTIRLQAFRASVDPDATAPARRPLELRLGAEGLPENPAWTAEIVDRSGRTVLQTSVEVDHDVALLRAHGLAPGTYWVRLSTTPEPGHSLREYQLSVK